MTVDRRVVLMSLGALGLLAACGRANDALSFDEFLDELVPMAEASVQRGVADQARYLDALAGLARRVAWPDLRGLVERRPVIVSRLELPSGKTFPLHDHRGYCALMYALSGRAIVRAYDEVASTRELRLAPRAPLHLAAGDTAIARDGHANIHGIESTQDVLLVDIFTVHAKPRSRLVEIERANADGTFAARWGAVL
jgi:hypothetical protein